jgi:hypothetical protein
MTEIDKNPDQRRRAYEGDDVNEGRLLSFAAGVVALVIFGVLVSAAVFHFFVRHQPLGPPASPFEDIRAMPPEPRLQTAAPLDLKHYREGQDEILHSYAWVDPKSDVVRIPVERAMDILLQKGYPVRGSSPAPGAATKPPRAAAATSAGQTASAAGGDSGGSR